MGCSSRTLQVVFQSDATCSVCFSAALHYAADSGHTEVVAHLVIAGCSVAHRNRMGWTPAHLAACHGFAAPLEKLVMAGFSPDTPGGPGAADGQPGSTAMHLAASAGSLEVGGLLTIALVG